MKKRILKWTVGIMMFFILIPILLILIIPMLLYLPPVQRWAVDKAVEIAKDETGMQVNIGSVSLDFPLDLAINDVVVLKTKNNNIIVNTDSIKVNADSTAVDTFAVSDIDTIAIVKRFVADVELLPLFKGRVNINAFELEGVSVNTSDLVAAAKVKGTINSFTLQSRGIDLGKQEVVLNNAALSGADLDVWMLNDTTSADTTTSETLWRVLVDGVSLEKAKVAYHTIGDSMTVRADIGSLQVSGGEIDLGKALYAVDAITIRDAAVNYDNNMADSVPGLDVNHIALDSINLALDSIYYNAPTARIHLKEFALREKCGLEILKLECLARMDSAALHIPDLKLLMPSSDLEAQAKVDLNVMDERNPGQLYLRLFASVGKEDVMLFCKDLPQSFRSRYPVAPMIVRGSVNGNTKHLDISGLSVELPTAFKLAAKGTADNITDMDRLRADVEIDGGTGSLVFVEALADADGTGAINIPDSITLAGNVKAAGTDYDATLIVQQDSGTVTLTAAYRGAVEGYQAELAVSDFNLNNFLPKDSLYTVSAYLKAEGEGFDAFSRNTRMAAEAKITELRYGSWNLNRVNATLDMSDGRAHITIESHNSLAEGKVRLDALMSHDDIDATLVTDIGKADFHGLRITEKPFKFGMCGHIDLQSDLSETHKLEGYVNDLTIVTASGTYRPKDLNVEAFTNPDTIHAKVNTGDFTFVMRSKGGYMKILESLDSLSAEMQRQREQRIIDQVAMQRCLPVINLRLAGGPDNPISDLLRYKGIKFDKLRCALNTSPDKAITGRAYLYSYRTDSMQIDTVKMAIEHDSLEYIRLKSEVVNRENNPFVAFRALADAYLFGRKAGVELKCYDNHNDLGIMFGVHSEMCDSGINIRLSPESPVLGYKIFDLNQDNFILLGRGGKVRAGVELEALDGTGIKLYSTDEDNPDMLQDITLTLHRFQLDDFVSVIPYAPNITGTLNGDFRVMQDKDTNLSLLSSVSVNELFYEKNDMGDINSEFAYLMREDSTHVVNATFSQNEREIALLDGSYKTAGDGFLDATLSMMQFPLTMLNGFVPGGLLGFRGYAQGDLAVKGSPNKPVVDGTLSLDSTRIFSRPYGLRMRADDKPIRFERSKLLFEDYSIYSSNDQPLTINGNIDFSDFGGLDINLRMRAKDYLLVNSKRGKKSIAYGKAYVNFFALVRGQMNDLRVRGRLDVLGKTDLTYILKDSPLSTDDRLKELVTFTDFRDTSHVVVKRPPIGGMDMQLTVNVERGSRVMCALNTQQTNYLILEGGGELSMLYSAANDLQLFGRYTVTSGEMKYSLPVIPLKTFTLKEGSYIEFAGEVMNPKLNLTATEMMTSQVSSADGSTRSVQFDCGVKISQTLNNMGLEFILDAPSDMTMRNELSTLSVAQKSKLAVTMLTTGMYLNENSGSNFSMNSALSSFLQNEINNITNNAMQSVDINVGMDQKKDATGQTSTDYSFKFAKRFWNNRFSFVIGGKVSSGNSSSMSAGNDDNAYINNVSLEYRLDNTAQRNVRLFYNKEANDLFADKVQEYGAGFVWRKKMNNLSELFKSSKNTTSYRRLPGQTTTTRRNPTSVIGDSTVVKRDTLTATTVQAPLPVDSVQSNEVKR